MIAAMGMYATLQAEIHHVRLRALDVVQIRVSTDAIPGSVTTTMLTPERLRALRPYVIHLQGRETPDALADPTAAERLREIVMHPDDWFALLEEPDTRFALRLGMAEGEPDRIFGIPVAR